MKLTPHFTLAEMTVSETAARQGIENSPDAHIINNLLHLCAVLERVRNLVGQPILVSSGYRSTALNAFIGGAANSAHCLGLAADFIVPDLTPRQLAQAVADSDLEFDQLILEYDQWVHLGLAQGPLRQQILTIRKGSGYLLGLV